MQSDSPDIVIDETILAACSQKPCATSLPVAWEANFNDLLVQVYTHFTPPDARSPEFLELLHGLYVLEYENDDLWYDLHPLVTDLLRRKNLLPDAA